MSLDSRLYRSEMTELLKRALRKFQAGAVNEPVYVVSIWTDPNAAASAIAVETLRHSVEFTGREGIHNDSPADFEYRFFAECEHKSFSINWEEITSSACWDILEPELDAVGQQAVALFKGVETENEAILGINSRRDWFDKRWHI